jgi:hypothetical protein
MAAQRFLQELAGLTECDLALVKALMHGSENPAGAHPSAPWLYDVVSDQPLVRDVLTPAACILCYASNSYDHKFQHWKVVDCSVPALKASLPGELEQSDAQALFCRE